MSSKPTAKRRSRRARRVLLVDDEAPSRNATCMALLHFGCEVDTAENAAQALDLFDPNRHDLVITDNRMPEVSGVELARQLRQIAPQTPIIMYTGFAPETPPPVDCLLEKPVPLDTLEATLNRLVPLD